MKYFVCSDIHGFTTILKNALVEKGFDINNKDHKLIIVGDIFDRGDEPIELIDFLNSLGDRFIFIRGNHEDLFFEALNEFNESWTVYTGYHISNKTARTIYQLANANKLDAAVELLNKSINYYELGKYIFTHSCLPFNYQETTDKAWANARCGNPFLQPKLEGKTIVFGHWHCGAGKKKLLREEGSAYDLSVGPFITDDFIGLDTCTVITNKINIIIFEQNDENNIKLIV